MRNWLLQSAFGLRRRLIGLLRLRTRGVKVMLFNADGEILLIRNSYGATGHFVLPGGGIHRGETPESAAAREVMEEVAIDCRDLALLGQYESRSEGKRDLIHLFRATGDGPASSKSIEIGEAVFCLIDRLPEGVSPATLRRIDEYLKKRAVSETW